MLLRGNQQFQFTSSVTWWSELSHNFKTDHLYVDELETECFSPNGWLVLETNSKWNHVLSNYSKLALIT